MPPFSLLAEVRTVDPFFIVIDLTLTGMNYFLSAANLSAND